MSVRTILFALTVASLSACATKGAKQSTVEMRFTETPEGGAARSRSAEQHPLNVSLIRGAALKYLTPADLLKAAETPTGGSPQLLMKASRSLAPGGGIVLLGTARDSNSGGSATQLAVFQLALACAEADIDVPGDLKACNGYFLRVPKEWPAEIYELIDATVSVIPEGGTAHGRLRIKSKAAGFTVEVEGEFTASMLEIASP